MYLRSVDLSICVLLGFPSTAPEKTISLRDQSSLDHCSASHSHLSRHPHRISHPHSEGSPLRVRVITFFMPRFPFGKHRLGFTPLLALTSLWTYHNKPLRRSRRALPPLWQLRNPGIPIHLSSLRTLLPLILLNTSDQSH